MEANENVLEKRMLADEIKYHPEVQQTQMEDEWIALLLYANHLGPLVGLIALVSAAAHFVLQIAGNLDEENRQQTKNNSKSETSEPQDQVIIKSANRIGGLASAALAIAATARLVFRFENKFDG